jgi:hypothetical protein
VEQLAPLVQQDLQALQAIPATLEILALPGLLEALPEIQELLALPVIPELRATLETLGQPVIKVLRVIRGLPEDLPVIPAQRVLRVILVQQGQLALLEALLEIQVPLVTPEIPELPDQLALLELPAL